MFTLVDHPPSVVVIGYGFAGRSFHRYLIGLAPGLVLHGVCARDPDRRAQAAAERGCRTYAAFDEVLADPAVDLVVLATPNHTHASLAPAALGAGKPVVTDKIMCLTVAEADAMIDAARRHRRLLSVFQNRRWDGDFLTLRALLAEGALGELCWLELAWRGPRPMRRWRAEAAQGGGRLHDLGGPPRRPGFAGAAGAHQVGFCPPAPRPSGNRHREPCAGGDRLRRGATAVIDTGSMHLARTGQAVPLAG